MSVLAFEFCMHAQCFCSKSRVPVLLCFPARMSLLVSSMRYNVSLDSVTLICLSHVCSLWQSELLLFQMLELDFEAYVRLKDSCHMFLDLYDWSPSGLICHVCLWREVAPTQ